MGDKDNDWDDRRDNKLANERELQMEDLQQVVLTLAKSSEPVLEETTQEVVDRIAKRVFIAEATHMYERDPELYESVHDAGVKLGEFLGKIERGELVLNDEGEWVPPVAE